MDLVTLTTQFGISGATVYVAYKVVSKLYTDMRSDSIKREDKLMKCLEKQSNSLAEQSATMSEISNTLKTMDSRICVLEKHNRGGNSSENYSA